MSQENVEIVRQMLDAFNRGDMSAVTAAFDEDCELHEPPETPDTPASGFHGHDGVRHWMTNLRDVAEIQFEARDFRAQGDLIFSEWIAHGSGHSSGVPIQWTSYVLLQMRAAKILRAQAFLGRDQAMDAAGLSD